MIDVFFIANTEGTDIGDLTEAEAGLGVLSFLIKCWGNTMFRFSTFVIENARIQI